MCVFVCVCASFGELNDGSIVSVYPHKLISPGFSMLLWNSYIITYGNIDVYGYFYNEKRGEKIMFFFTTTFNTALISYNQLEKIET